MYPQGLPLDVPSGLLLKETPEDILDLCATVLSQQTTTVATI